MFLRALDISFLRFCWCKSSYFGACSSAFQASLPANLFREIHLRSDMGSSEDQDLYRISARRAEAKRSYADINLDRSEVTCRIKGDFTHRFCGRPNKKSLIALMTCKSLSAWRLAFL